MTLKTKKDTSGVPNYRHLNSKTKKDVCFLSRIANFSDILAGPELFLALDLTNCYSDRSSCVSSLKQVKNNAIIWFV